MQKTYLALAFAVMLLAVAGFASADTTMISGKVYDKDIVTGPTVPGATVNVLCNSTVLTTTSIAAGAYAVSLDTKGCGIGDTAHINATFEGRFGSTNATVGAGPVIAPDLQLDYAVGNVVLVPEFGLVAGIVTLFGSIVAFMIIRRN